MVTNSLNTFLQIDTGADVSVIPEKLYKKLQAPLLESTKRSLIGPSQDKLQVRGQFTGTLVHNSKTVQDVVYVVKGLHKAFIGRPAITVLQLVSHINAIDSV